MSMRGLLTVRLQAAESPVAERWFQSGTLGTQDIPANPDTPYGQIKKLQPIVFREVQGTSRAANHLFQVFVYDRPFSYVVIDEILAVVRETALGLVGQVSAAGVQCTDVKWLGNSQDIEDATKKMFAKFTTIQMTASE